MTAFYDFFRKVKLYTPDGTLLNTIEADSVTDSIEFMAGEGVRWNNVNDSTVDGFIFDVKYDFAVPPASTTLRLSDVNGNNKDIDLVAGGNMTITRDNSGQITIAALIGGVSKSISNITQTNPVRVTTTNDHNFTEGTPVTIVDVVGMTNVNGNEYFMNVINGTTFDLYTDDQLTTTLDGTGFSAYTSGGVATADYGGAKQAFKTIRVSGQTDVVADTITDILTLEGGTGIDITTTAGTDKVSYAIDSTVATLTGSQTLTNKSISGSGNTLTAIPNSALVNSGITFERVGGNSTVASLGDTVGFQGTAGEVTVGESSGVFTIGLPSTVSITTALTVNSDTATTNTATQTLTNKTIDLTDNTLSGTFDELNTAVSDATLVDTFRTQTLSSKTLTSPVINGMTGTGNIVVTGSQNLISTSTQGQYVSPVFYLDRNSI